MKKLFKHPFIVCVLSFIIMFLGVEYLISLSCKYPEQPYQWKIIVTVVLAIISCLIGIISLFVCFSNCFDIKKKYEQQKDECTDLGELTKGKKVEESLSIKPLSKSDKFSILISFLLWVGMVVVLSILEEFNLAISIVGLGYFLLSSGVKIGIYGERCEAAEKEQSEAENHQNAIEGPQG